MIDHTKLIVGSLYAISVATGAIAVYGATKLAYYWDVYARTDENKTRQKLANRMLEIIDNAGLPDGVADEIRDRLDQSL